MARLNPKHYTVNELLQGRLFRIPNYQRAYSWTNKQRADLFNDIETAIKSGQEHFMATIVGLAKEKREIGVNEFQAIEVVDGQQRITTIVILLKAIEIKLSANKNEEKSVKEQINKLMVKGDDHSLILLQTNHDSGDVFQKYLRLGVLPKGKPKTAAEKNLTDAINESIKFLNKFNNSDEMIRLIATIRNKLTILFHELSDEAMVYKVFEVLNSRGLEVKWLDKFKSQLMALIFETADNGTREETIDEMREIWGSIYRILGLRSSLGDEALRFAGTLNANNLPNRVLSQEDAVAVLINEAGNDLKSIIRTAHKLKDVVSAVDELNKEVRLSAVTQIAHARFVATALLLREYEIDSNKQELIRYWEKVTFRIFGLGNADSRNKVGEYVRLGHQIQRLDIESIKDGIASLGEGFSISEVIKRRDWRYCYDGWAHELRYLLFRYDESLAKKSNIKLDNSDWNLIWAKEPSKTIEHIIPKSSKVKYIHELGNLTMLPPKVNSSLGKKPPKEKASIYIDCGIRATRAVGRSIEKMKWNKSAVNSRTEELLTFVRKEWAD